MLSQHLNEQKRRTIFVGGIERSGTTIIAAALARHTGGVALPEAQFKKLLVGRDQFARRDLRQLRRHFRFRLWDLALDESGLLGRSGREVYSQLADQMLVRHGLPLGGVIIDHTPENTGLLPGLLDAFDGLGLVHVVRDPRAVIASLLRTDWNLPDIDRALAFWHERNRLAEIALVAAENDSRIVTLRYEEFCEDPLMRLDRALSCFDGVPRPSGEPAAILVPRYTHSQHRRISEPPSNEDGWKQQLSPHDARRIESALAGTTIGRYYGFSGQERLPPPRRTSVPAPGQWLRARLRRLRRGVDRVNLAPLPIPSLEPK